MAVDHAHAQGAFGATDRNAGAAPDGAGLGTWANIAGAAVSLALVIGISVWGYRQMVRDVSGVPVVRALDGPMRVQPNDPGGEPADHQGLAVNSVAAEGTAEAPAERLVLAPEPVDLADEDQPMAIVSPTPVVPTLEPPRPDTAPDAVVSASADAGAVEALVAQLSAGVEPLEPLDPEPAAMAAPAAAAAIDAPGVARSPRPPVRPDDLAATPVSADAGTAATEVAALDVDPTAVPAGTRLVQLGAFDSPDVARAEWDKLFARFTDYLDGKKRVIQKASSGGRTFYRLRAMGFADLSDARRFCSALVADNADCIPVVAR